MKKKLLLIAVIILTLVIVGVIAGVIVFQQAVIHIQLPHRAVLHVLPCSKDNSTHSAIILCPGGGYSHLEKWSEGYMWFPFFYKRGYTVAMLEYRMPKLDHRSPLIDGTEAIRLMRRRAGEWNFKTDSIGVMGFSAGGHLASSLLVNGKASDRPDFGILFYPVVSMRSEITHKGSHDHLLGVNAARELELRYSSELHVSDQTPPVYIAVSSNDMVVKPGNTLCFYDAMLAKKRPVTLRVFPSIDHGWGYQLTFSHHDEMLEDLTSWLKSRQQEQTNKDVEE